MKEIFNFLESSTFENWYLSLLLIVLFGVLLWSESCIATLFRWFMNLGVGFMIIFGPILGRTSVEKIGYVVAGILYFLIFNSVIIIRRKIRKRRWQKQQLINAKAQQEILENTIQDGTYRGLMKFRNHFNNK